MPTINVNLADVQAWDNLPIGSYYGEVTKITYRPAKEAGKFPQFMATYLVADGDQIGRQSNEWVSFSPKALGRMKRWFMKFGLGDIPDLAFDDETDELAEPDLYGSKVIFTVTQDRNDATRFRTELVSVEELGPGVPDTGEFQAAAAPVAAAPAPVAAPVRRGVPAAAPAPALEPEPETEEVEEAPAAEAPKPVVRRAPAAASAQGAAPARGQQPVRRTLR